MHECIINKNLDCPIEVISRKDCTYCKIPDKNLSIKCEICGRVIKFVGHYIKKRDNNIITCDKQSCIDAAIKIGHYRS